MRAYQFLLLLVIPIIFSCDKQTEVYVSEPLSDYTALQTGKYITYRVDSTIFKNFGQTIETHSYQEKNVVDAQITDALDRPSYRILRYLRDVAGTQPWAPSGSLFITPLSKSVEVIENNLRFVKLALPIKQNFTWKGNDFLPSGPFENSYGLPDSYSQIGNWDYVYSAVGQSVTVNGQSFNNVITVQAIADSINATGNNTVINNTASGLKFVSIENYAKGIGLITQTFTMWEYQPPVGGTAGHYNGFGVKRSIIDHN